MSVEKRRGLDPAWEAFFERALAAQPSNRFQSAGEMSAALALLALGGRQGQRCRSLGLKELREHVRDDADSRHVAQVRVHDEPPGSTRDLGLAGGGRRSLRAWAAACIDDMLARMSDALSAGSQLILASLALGMALGCGDGSSSGGGGAEETTTVRRVLCGTDSTCTDLVLDSSGRVLSETHYGSCDGTCAERDTYSYDAGPNPTSKKVDRECDGSTDWGTSYTYDASGRIATTDYDDDGNGMADGNSCSAYEDVAGEEIERLDVDCDGSVDRCWARTRDASGRVVTERELVAPECTGASNCRAYGYDATGRMISSAFDSSCDGTNESSLCYEYE